MENTLFEILLSVDKKLSKLVQTKRTWAEIAVLITSTLCNDPERLQPEVVIQIRDKSMKNLKSLAIISWYVPEIFRFYLQEKLLSMITKNEDFYEVRFLLQSKAHFNVYLGNLFQAKGGYEIFGNLLNVKNYDFNVFQLKVFIKNPNQGSKIPEKRYIGVGYKDKGYLPDPSKSGLAKIDFKLTQNKIEEKRASTEDTYHFIEGFLE